MTSIRITTIAFLLFLTGCRDWKPSRPSWPEHALTGLRTLGMKRSIVYPYSVIAGGVETRADVQEAAERDPDVARHYDDVNIPGLEPVTLKNDTMAYVSYRKGGQIYWTSRQVHLAKGERILSDGRNCVRGRCGNRISWQPRTPVLPKEFREPNSAQLNTPEVRGQSIDELPIPPVFSPIHGSDLPVSLANVIAATEMPLPGAPAFLGGVETSGGSGGVGGMGGGGGAGGAGGGPSGVINSSNFVPAILNPITGTPTTTTIFVYPGTPSTGNPGVQPSYPIAVSVPPTIWTTSTIRIETVTSTSVHSTPPPNYPPYWPPPPSSPTPPEEKPPNRPQPPSNPGPPPENPTPPSPIKPQGDTSPPDTSVPEPATLGLMAVAIGGLWVSRRLAQKHAGR